jgi:hypothetical protein
MPLRVRSNTGLGVLVDEHGERQMMHTMKDGKQIALIDMSDKHLLATLAMIDRKAKAGVVIQSGGILFCHDEPWYEQHTAYGAEALDAMNAAEYAKEAVRRGLTPNVEANRL